MAFDRDSFVATFKPAVEKTDYNTYISEASSLYGEDPTNMESMFIQESGFNPLAISPTGATGFAQFTRGTAKDVGLENRFDPEESIKKGVKYYSGLRNQLGGDPQKAHAAYNAGIAYVKAASDEYGEAWLENIGKAKVGGKTLNERYGSTKTKEVQDHVKKIMGRQKPQKFDRDAFVAEFSRDDFLTEGKVFLEEAPSVPEPSVPEFDRNAFLTDSLAVLKEPVSREAIPEVQDISGIPEPEKREGFIKGTLDALAYGLDQVGLSIGNIVEWGGDATNSETIQNIGKKIQNVYEERPAIEAPPEMLQKSVADDPSLLLNPEFLVQQTMAALPSFAIAIGGTFTGAGVASLFTKAPKLIRLASLASGGLTGGTLEGSSTYKEMKDEGFSEGEATMAGLGMVGATTALNAVGLSKILRGLPEGLKGKVISAIGSGAWESITELAEEPAEVLIKNISTGEFDVDKITPELIESIKQGVNVVPASFILGALGAGAAGIKAKPAIEKEVIREDIVPDVKEQPAQVSTEQASTKEVRPELKEGKEELSDINKKIKVISDQIKRVPRGRKQKELVRERKVLQEQKRTLLQEPFKALTQEIDETIERANTPEELQAVMQAVKDESKRIDVQQLPEEQSTLNQKFDEAKSKLKIIQLEQKPKDDIPFSSSFAEIEEIVPLKKREKKITNPLDEIDSDIKFLQKNPAKNKKHIKSLQKLRKLSEDDVVPRVVKPQIFREAVMDISKKGKKVVIVSADGQNLKAVNDYRKTHAKANKDLKEVWGKLQRIAEANDGLTSRDQGDELALAFIGKNVEEIESIVGNAKKKLQNIIKTRGLSKLTHSRMRIPEFGALNIDFGVVEMKKGRLKEAIEEADQIATARKEEFQRTKAAKMNYIYSEELGYYVPKKQAKKIGVKPQIVSRESVEPPVEQQVPEGARRSSKSPEQEIAQTAATIEKELKPGKKPRKFLKTVKESSQTTKEMKEAVKAIEPQDYDRITNDKSLREADREINRDRAGAKKELLSNSPVSAKKSAIAIRLLKKAEADKNYEEAKEILDSYDKQLREAGRFVQAASLWNKLSPTGMVRVAEKVAEKKKINLPEDVKKQIFEDMQRIQKLPPGEERDRATFNLMNKIAENLPLKFGELFEAFRYQNMLSNPRSHQRNLASALLNAFITRPAVLGTQSTYEMLRHPFNPAARDVSLLDVPAYMKGLWTSVPNAMAAARESYKRGYSTQKLDFGRGDSTIEMLRKTKMPKAVSFVPRLMEAEDIFVSSMIAAGEQARLLKKGKPKDEATVEARKLAEQYLFREKLDVSNKAVMVRALDGLGKLALSGRNMPGGVGKVWSWMVPFVTTPINIAKMNVRFSPTGLVGKDISKEDKAKAILGTTIMGMGAMLAMAGRTAWKPPRDKREKELFYAAGKKPYSVKIGKVWFPMWYFGPFALALAYPSALKHYHSESPTALSDSEIKKLTNAHATLVQFIASQTSLTGMSNFIRLAEGDIDVSLEKNIGFAAGQILPFQGMVRYINTLIDPVYRKAKGFKESIQKDLPILSKKLEPYDTPLGEPAKRDPVNYFLPYDVGKLNPIFQQMYDNAIMIKQQNNLVKELKKSRENELRGTLGSL